MLFRSASARTPARHRDPGAAHRDPEPATAGSCAPGRTREPRARGDRKRGARAWLEAISCWMSGKPSVARLPSLDHSERLRWWGSEWSDVVVSNLRGEGSRMIRFQRTLPWVVAGVLLVANGCMAIHRPKASLENPRAIQEAVNEDFNQATTYVLQGDLRSALPILKALPTYSLGATRLRLGKALRRSPWRT